MGDNSSIKICPLCKKPGKVTRKWVRNKTGKKYYYQTFHHYGTIHRISENSLSSTRIHKDNTRKELLDLLNSIRFKRAVFTVNDLVDALDKNTSSPQYYVVSKALLNFVNDGIISLIRKGRNVYFVNTPQNGKINYFVKDISIELLDSKRDGQFSLHRSMIRIINDNQYPLSYLQYRAFGDNYRKKEEVSIKAIDVSNKRKLNVYYLEDDPLEKRVIIQFSDPILPRKEGAFLVEYYWPETEPSYTFTASTDLSKLSFSIASMKRHILFVSKTNSSQTASSDLSNVVTYKKNSEVLEVAKFEYKNIPSFVMLKFRWT